MEKRARPGGEFPSARSSLKITKMDENKKTSTPGVPKFKREKRIINKIHKLNMLLLKKVRH